MSVGDKCLSDSCHNVHISEEPCDIFLETENYPRLFVNDEEGNDSSGVVGKIFDSYIVDW